MLTKETTPHDEDEYEVNVASLIPVAAEERVFPTEPNHPTNMDADEIEVAGGWLGTFGTAARRKILGTTGVYGDSYLRLQKKLLEKAEREGFGTTPREEAVEALRPNQPGELDPSAPVTQPRTLLPDGDDAAAPQPMPDEAYPTQPGLVDDVIADDGYARWITLGDEDMDEIARGALNPPEVRDGVIAGLRVKGTTPGMETKVPDEGHIYGLIQSTGRVLERKLADKSPDELASISLEQTASLANLIGANPNKLARQMTRGQFQLNANNPGEFAATVVAAKNMLITEIRKLDELADQAAASRSDADRFAFKEQMELVANLQRSFKGVQTDIARALSAQRLAVAGDADLLGRDYSKMVGELGGVERVDAQIDAYRNLPDAAQRANATRKLGWKAKSLDAIHDVWVNSLLSGWFTHVKNTAGVVGAMVWDIAEESLTATRQSMGRAGYGPKAQDVTFGDVGAKVFGQTMALREAMNASGRAFWLREEALQGAEMSLISGAGNNPLRKDGFSAAAFEMSNSNFARAVDFMGNILTLGRAPTRALMAEDAFMKVVMYRGSLYEQAYRAARLQGLKGDDFSDFVAEFLSEPPRDARDTALDAAKYVTLQTDMEGQLKELQRITGNRFMRVLVPFYKTPMNALLYVAERSPLAKASFVGRYQKAFEEGGAAAANANTRMAMGTAMMVMLWQNWEAGDITGGLSPDPRLRKAYLRQGIKPYHVRFGDTYYNYGMAEPLSTIVGLVMDTMEVVNHPDTDDMEVEEIVAATAGVIGYNLTNKSFMTGIQSFMDATRNPGRFGPKLFANYARSALPGSAMSNEMKLALDEMKRYHNTIRNMYKSRLPGLSEDLPHALDLWGRPINIGSRFMSPYKENAVDQELIRIGLGLNEHPKSISDDHGVVIGLEPEEVHFYHKTAGEAAFKMLDLLIRTPNKFNQTFDTNEGTTYKSLRKASLKGKQLATQELKNIYRKILTDARKMARDELFYNSPFSEQLQAQSEGVRINRKNEAEETKRAMQ
jgi:hypothetical protein